MYMMHVYVYIIRIMHCALFAMSTPYYSILSIIDTMTIFIIIIIITTITMIIIIIINIITFIITHLKYYPHSSLNEW